MKATLDVQHWLGAGMSGDRSLGGLLVAWGKDNTRREGNLNDNVEELSQKIWLWYGAKSDPSWKQETRGGNRVPASVLWRIVQRAKELPYSGGLVKLGSRTGAGNIPLLGHISACLYRGGYSHVPGAVHTMPVFARVF